MFEAPNPEYARLVKQVVLSFPICKWLGLEFIELGPGTAEVAFPFKEDLCQAAGFVQGGIVGTLADLAAGAAAGTLLPAGKALVTADFTVKLLAPAGGDRLVSRATVIKVGRSTTVTRADVFAEKAGRERLCATALVGTTPIDFAAGVKPGTNPG